MTDSPKPADCETEVLKAEYSHQTDIHTAMMGIHKQVTDVHLVVVGILISGIVVGAAQLRPEISTALLLPFGITAVTWALVINNMLFKLRYRFIVQLIAINYLRKRLFSRIDSTLGERVEAIYKLPHFFKLDSVMLDRVYIVVLTSSFLVLVSSATWIGSQGSIFEISYLIILISAWVFTVLLILVLTSWLSNRFTKSYVEELRKMGTQLQEQRLTDRAVEIPGEDQSARTKVYRLVAASSFALIVVTLLSLLLLPQASLQWATTLLCLMHSTLCILSLVQSRLDSSP